MTRLKVGMKTLVFALISLWLFTPTAKAQLAVPITNAGSTGTTINLLAVINSSNNAVIATTSSTTVPTYIVAGGAGTTGQAQLTVLGQASCTFDATNASAAGWFYVIASTTTGGDCHAQSGAPSAGTWIIGYLAAASTSSGSASLVNVNSYIYGGSGGGGTTTNALTLNNSGAGATSGTTFNGGAAVTLSYNTIGAAPAASPTFTGTVTTPLSTAGPVLTSSGGVLSSAAQITAAQGGTGITTAASTGVPQLSSGTWSISTTLPSGLSATNLTLTTPSLGAATATSILATGIVDGEAPVTITTGTTGTPGGTYNSGYTINHEGTAATAVTYTLPTAAAGKQYCVKNGNNGSAADTGVLTIQVSAAGQSIVYNGTAGASNGNLVSTGAAGDAACVLGISSTQWEAFVQQGTWAVH